MSTLRTPSNDPILSPGYGSATSNDPLFSDLFRHGFADIDGVQMHYVTGGDGPIPIVLLHGFTETWYGWLPIMPELLPGHTVVAVDLPGLGDTSGPLPSHDKKTLAGYIHRLLDRLGHTQGVQLVSHDFGGALAYALVAQWRDQFSGWLVMDFPITGGSLSYEEIRSVSFHFSFHEQEPLFEQLVGSNVRIYLDYFYRTMSGTGDQPVNDRTFEEYVRAYSRPGVLHNGSRYYQAWREDEIDNARAMTEPLAIPVHMIAQEQFLDTFLLGARDVTPHATGQALNTGHWMLHEAPRSVLAEIKRFFRISDQTPTD